MGVKRRRFKGWECKRKTVEHLSFLWIETVRLEVLEGEVECGMVLWGDLDVSKQLSMEAS
jgi:hypothetical protein